LSDVGLSDPAVSLIVVNFNGAKSIRACVDSLFAERSVALQIIVVDNASEDASAAVLQSLTQEHASLEVIRSDRNRGYAGAVNFALPSCRGRYVGVLNMDLIAESCWIGPLVDFLDSSAEVGAANPLITLWDGSTVNAIGQDLHVTGLGFNRGLGRQRSAIGDAPFRCDGLHGAAFLVRQDTLNAVGGMDESGFLYHEDVNLSWMLRMMGLQIYCVPRSVVRHDYFLSMHPEKLFLLERNRWSLLLTALHWSTLVLISPVLLLTEVMLWMYALLRGKRFLAAKARSYRALWNGRRERRSRRADISRFRRVGDFQLLRQFKWGYAWSQFATLALERAEARKPFRSPERPGRPS
jgi:GT2 family glycosyltransferase